MVGKMKTQAVKKPKAKRPEQKAQEKSIDRRQIAARVRTENGHETANILSAEQKKMLVKEKMKAKKAAKVPHSTQDTLTFEE